MKTTIPKTKKRTSDTDNTTKKLSKKVLGFYKAIHKHKNTILDGSILALDPATGSGSSAIGWALFDGCELVESGTIEVTKSWDLADRFKAIHECLVTEFPEVDIVAIEQITKRRTTHISLLYSMGVFHLAKADSVILVPPTSWHAIAGEGYEKSDSGDAEQIGWCLIKKAQSIIDGTK